MKSEIDIQKKIRACDIFVLFIFILMLGTRFFTIAMVTDISQTTNSTISAVTQLFEANPLASLFFKLKGFGLMLNALVIPAVAMTVYFVFRKLTLNGKVSADNLYFYCMLTFFIMLANMINDAAYYVSKFI